MILPRRLLVLFILLFSTTQARAAVRFGDTYPTDRIRVDAPETIAVAVALRVPELRITFPSSGRAWNGAGSQYLSSGSNLDIRAAGAEAQWFFDSATPGPASPIWRFPAPDTGLLRLNGRAYRGELIVQCRLETAAEPLAAIGLLSVINVVPLEHYLRGVVPKEIGFLRVDNFEAMKAQAVAARTYAARNLGKWRDQGFDLMASSLDQVYGGADAETTATDRAVRETEDEIMALDGKLIDAFYHSTCGGRTAEPSSIWSGGSRPGLGSVDDTLGDTAACRASRYFTWTELYVRETLAALAAPATALYIDILRRDTWGRNLAIRLTRGDSMEFAEGDTIRRVLRRPEGVPLRSTWFSIASDTAWLRISGRGWGHGVGMCQMGAIARSQSGEGYRSILRTYYPAADVRRLRKPVLLPF